MDGTWAQSWEWNAPDWADINDPDTSAVGFVYGNGLADDDRATLDEFIAGLAAGAQGRGGINLWKVAELPGWFGVPGRWRSGDGTPDLVPGRQRGRRDRADGDPLALAGAEG
jgi:hypothetical protein